MAKASKKILIRSFLVLLLVFFITVAELFFLRLAISLMILWGLGLVYYYFDDRYVPFSHYFIYFVFLFLLLLWIAFDIRRWGAKNFWKALILYNTLYTGTFGKYYKWFVFILVFMCILTALVILQGLI
jgi:hypothetical protein